jgi:hypothetical protein
LEDTNIFNIQRPATASQLSRGYTYIFDFPSVEGAVSVIPTQAHMGY